MGSHLARLNSRVLTSILLVGLPVLVIGTAVVVGIGQWRLRESQSLQLARLAEYAAAATDAYFYRRILDTAMLGRVPEIRQAAIAGSKQTFETADVGRLEKEWQAQKNVGAPRTGILATPASEFLIDLIKHDSIYREVLVTDRHGRLVAASNITSDYYQADEPWWTDAYDSGRGRVSVSDVRLDESAHVYAFEIAVPVPGSGDNDVAGIMKVVADSREMLAAIAGLELGMTMEATLVRHDGSIVFSRRPYAEGNRFFGAELLRQTLEDRASRKQPADTIRYEARTGDGTRRVVAVAPSQLNQSYPQLSWMMVVSADRDELLAPFSSLVWYLVLVFAFTGVAVLAIALWLSMRLATPAIDPQYDMHLVEHAQPAGSDEG